MDFKNKKHRRSKAVVFFLVFSEEYYFILNAIRIYIRYPKTLF